MILSAIAAMSRDRVIGVDNKLPWHLPEDLQFFRQMTKGKILIMGRKTFESLGGKPLPGRPHIVITRQKDYKVPHTNVKIVASLQAAVSLAKSMLPDFPDEVMILGGGEIYAQSLGILDRLYLTVIDIEVKGDAHFPSLAGTGLRLVSEEHRTGAHGFSIQTFEREKN